MIALLVLLIVGVALFAAFLGAAVLKGLFWLVLLPFRLLFALLLLPFLLLKAIVAGLLFLIAGPLLAIVAAIVVTALLAIPLAPVLLVLFAIWLLARPRRQLPLPAGPGKTPGLLA